MPQFYHRATASQQQQQQLTLTLTLTLTASFIFLLFLFSGDGYSARGGYSDGCSIGRIQDEVETGGGRGERPGEEEWGGEVRYGESALYTFVSLAPLTLIPHTIVLFPSFAFAFKPEGAAVRSNKPVAVSARNDDADSDPDNDEDGKDPSRGRGGSGGG